MIGNKLAHYEVTRHLGSGGMGEVYQATDTKLGRDVAIKLLPAAFENDPERVARFEREAKVLAALNHANIAAIHGLEQSDRTHFLVLELVEGETLAERIARGPMPVAEALEVGRQVVEALEAAHDKGVIHRDLKPSNIKLTPNGKVKVLDFGLAKALLLTDQPSALLSQSPTISMAATNAGIILGTAAYMSPEQAKGSVQLDQRSDIFSFGCVFYEMLTGRQAFQGETVTEVLASVLAREADFSHLPPRLNPKIHDLIRRCLDKDRKKRWQAVGDLRVEIESILADPRGVEIQTPSLKKPLAAWKLAALVLAGVALGAAIAGAALWNLRPSVPAKVTRFQFLLPEDQSFSRTGRQVVAISPDGMNIAYVANNQLYLRRIGDLESRPIQGTEQDVNTPFFSPDGQWIGFYSFQDSTLKKISIAGGAAVTLCETTNPFGASWDGDNIVFGEAGKGIQVVPATGGTPQVWARLEPNEFMDSPQILPGGNTLLFTVTRAMGDDRWDKAEIAVQSREGGERKVLIRGGSAGRYVPTGHIVYALGNNLLAVPFDLGRLEVKSGPVPIVEGIVRPDSINTGAGNFAFSEDGTLAYVPRTAGFGAGTLRVLALADRAGKTNLLALPPAVYDHPRLSRDGKQLAVATVDEGGTIWIYNLSGTTSLRRLTFEGANFNPIWSPDGRRVAFSSVRDGKRGVFLQNADGTGVAERLTTSVSPAHRPESWSPDGATIILSEITSDNSTYDQSIIGLKNERKVQPFETLSKTNQFHAAFSPDGRWVAYTSDESGSRQIYVQPLPKTGAKYQISRESADAPVWSPDGKELFYYDFNSRKLVAVRIQTQPSFSFGQPTPIPIEGVIQGTGSFTRYDVMPDGKRFLVLLPAAQGGIRSLQQIHVVLNWFEDLRRRVP